MKSSVRSILDELIHRYPELAVCREAVVKGYSLIRQCYEAGGKVLICGNGGSAADAEHMVGELMKSFLSRREIPPEDTRRLRTAFPEEGAYLAGRLQGALPAIALISQSALCSAYANDVAADMVYAQQVYGYGGEGDVLIGISTSGNTGNVLHAVRVAKSFGLRTLGLTGENGGKLGELCDVAIRVPAAETYRIQEYHVPVYHAVCAMLERTFFDG